MDMHVLTWKFAQTRPLVKKDILSEKKVNCFQPYQSFSLFFVTQASFKMFNNILIYDLFETKFIKIDTDSEHTSMIPVEPSCTTYSLQ